MALVGYLLGKKQAPLIERMVSIALFAFCCFVMILFVLHYWPYMVLGAGLYLLWKKHHTIFRFVRRRYARLREEKPF